MEETSKIDISDLYEKVIAIDVMLQFICSTLSQDQSGTLLQLIQKYRDHIISIAPESEMAATRKAMDQFTRFEEILAGLPSVPVVH
ncbi:hypothetical protein [Glaciimonas immobilis]|uniref:Uncharacterized protein n=1 Tax=Glaciimonas immobilis TaxID=728004 RepID=A0A840RPT2_9BURK|nr:hypothetical protein [Glaciimonas immobilis]KAF3999178.1 hypothetical protein HAV38_04370 [Glaciimonas immobilis]MBB5198630.1 hypothetical protein [Glaciimonas immobilis]